ncbi:heme ABC transporter ATP-binding protein [Paraburkholderia phenazinium]|jgi:iron complex transport system ATP-binding protein|uniref:Iron complex transport system ATP-binding protein n=1 Tax=Paraburkholderia phenazinium TaxID=60549 RepID=A0A1G8KS03_9BURK|nr:heme ABC transporter ATP-binding protein [Paraburkholderia phenazinium]SDI46143.1 iron complex transport system ATP-binding protein [Paraburkholderia phenazinium]
MLIASNLSVTRGETAVLRSLSLAVKPGALTALLGRNGVGKSTLLKALAGEFDGAGAMRALRMSGELTLNGEPLHAIPPQRLALLRAVLPQSSQPVFPFSVEEIVLLGRYPHVRGGAPSRRDREIVGEALALAEASGLAGREITTLSGGELARVQFARVLAQLWPVASVNPDQGGAMPRYLLLDEPTAALDIAHQHGLLATVRDMARRWNLGVLAIVHDPNLAARHADTIALLAQGTIIAQGTPHEIMRPELIERCYGFAVRMLDSGTETAPVAVPA